MNIRRVAVVVAAAFLFGNSAHSQSFLGPEGEFRTFLGRLEWESGCTEPAFYLDHDQAYSEYQDYVRCLRRRVQADAEYASKKVVEEAQDELRRVQSQGQAAGVLSY